MALVGEVRTKIERKTTCSEIADRIVGAHETLLRVDRDLRKHADRLGGEMPEECGDEPCQRESGAIGAIFDALDALDRTVASVVEQAGRNTTLA